MLRQIAPGVTRVAVLRDPTIASGIGQFGTIQSAAPSLKQAHFADSSRTSRDVREVPILLQKSPKREARCALAPTATHSVRAVALRGLR
jgi:hypothetical protein